MPAQRKLFFVVVIVVMGVAGAMLFRKPSAPDAAESAATPTEAAAGLEPAQHFDKPAPVSHLTGRIDPAETAVDGRGFTTPPLNDRGNFGLSTVPPATGGYSALRPATNDGAVATAGTGASMSAAEAPAGAGFNELRRHKIADGDTLSGLAVRYLGSADRYREIYELNRDILANPDLLPIGSSLKIPALGSKVSTPGSINNRPMVPVPPRGNAAPAAAALPGG
jgi:hypothetical protein